MKTDLFNELVNSIKEGVNILRGKKAPSREFDFENPDAGSIRMKYGLSQEKFAKLLAICIGTLRNWEQGRRKPEGPAKVLLSVADKHPKAILDSVQSQ